MTGVLIRRGTRDTGRRMPCEDRAAHKQKEGGNAKTETEPGVMLPQAKERLGLPATGRDKEGSYSRGFGGTMVLPTHSFCKTSSLQNHKKINFCCVKLPQFMVLCDGSARKLIQGPRQMGHGWEGYKG